MASYHLAVKAVSRGSGRSVVAAAAYRSGEKLENPRDGLVHDYSRRHGIEHSQLVGWDGTRQALWGQTEMTETRKNARLAVEVEASLPRELSLDDRKALALSFAQELAAAYRAPVDVCVHNHRTKEGEHPHVHILIGCRTVEDGALAKRVVPMDGPEEVERWRARWAEVQNGALERIGREERVDHRSLEAQHGAAIERVEQARRAEQAPEQVDRLQGQADTLDRTARTSLSRGAWQAELVGIPTHMGDLNRQIANDNAERRGVLDQLRGLRLVREVERVTTAAKAGVHKVAKGIANDGHQLSKLALAVLRGTFSQLGDGADRQPNPAAPRLRLHELPRGGLADGQRKAAMLLQGDAGRDVGDRRPPAYPVLHRQGAGDPRAPSPDSDPGRLARERAARAADAQARIDAMVRRVEAEAVAYRESALRRFQEAAARAQREKAATGGQERVRAAQQLREEEMAQQAAKALREAQEAPKPPQGLTPEQRAALRLTTTLPPEWGASAPNSPSGQTRGPTRGPRRGR